MSNGAMAAARIAGPAGGAPTGVRGPDGGRGLPPRARRDSRRFGGGVAAWPPVPRRFDPEESQR